MKHLKRSVLTLFWKRMVKFMVILLLWIALSIPLLQKSYDLAKERILDSGRLRISEGLKQLESRIYETQELASFLLNERAFQSLMLLSGNPQPSDYVYLNDVQEQLARLSLTKTGGAEVYILFRGNPLFISNHISSDDYQRAYPEMFSYRGRTVSQWREALFGQTFTVKLLGQEPVYSRYYAGATFEGITCLVNNSPYDSLPPSSILACVFDRRELLNGFLEPQQQDEAFAYVSDAQGNRFFTHSSVAQGVPPVSPDPIQKVNGRNFVILNETSEALGLKAVVGIPEELFWESVSPMVRLLFLYTALGFFVMLAFALYLSVRETISMERLIEVASSTSQIAYGRGKNEYSFLNHAIRRIGDEKEEQLRRIDTLCQSIRASSLEKLLLLGVCTDEEEEAIRSSLGRDFSSYSVLKCRCRFGLAKDCQPLYHLAFLQMEQEFPHFLKNPILTLHLAAEEFAILLFFDGNDSCDLEPVKERLTAFVRRMEDTLSPTPILHIGVSALSSGVSNVRNAYLQACYAINQNDGEGGGVYRYATPKALQCPKAFDLALPLKLYDRIISGDKTSVRGAFSEALINANKERLSEDAFTQLYFAFRQPVYNAYVETQGARVCEESSTTFPFFRPEAANEILFSELLTKAEELCDAVHSGQREKHQKLKSDLEEFLRQHASEPSLCAEQAAKALCLSEKYVFTLIKEQTGKSFMHYLEDIRVAKAEHLLVETGEPNTRICELCGFGSENTFYRAFSKKHGVSPNVWRKQNRQSGLAPKE